ncbi:hypothetical protein KVR01_002876 [Diaporthe batatas]|uniref:uncharacterized protein n=1 Tax=Diaporthe batatas TaxID=748121 RepID=UPI001D047CD3|nr:uncharacterized protein KVR01_002876 [Diaporthe batatas]KAG8167187.1 hypothetical protein KVR01_002876 [Diaporthe batatas]
MRSSLLLVTGASIAAALPKVEIVTETDIVYYTVVQEVTTVQTVPADKPVNVKVVPTTVAQIPVVTVTIDADLAGAPASTSSSSSVKAAAPSAPAAKPSDLASTAVYHHNIHRANNSAPAMSWGATYAGYAATVAASCKFAHDLTPGGGGYGQNIAMYASTDATSLTEETVMAQAITEMWYNGELDLYPSNAYGQANPDFTNFEAWGHYSQIVWVGSTQVGCAAQYCAPGTMNPTMGAWYSVCNYFPAGNVNGAYGKNVLPPTNQATVNANVAA